MDMDKNEIQKLVAKKQKKYGVPVGLLAGVVQRESGFNAAAVGADGELGLAQLLPGGAIAEWEQFNEPLTDYLTPENNLEVAAWYLGKRIPQMLRHYKKPVTIENRIIAYNAGIGRVLNGPVPELTKDYIAEVKGYMSGSSDGITMAQLLIASALAGLALA